MDEPWASVRWENDHDCAVVEWKAFATHAEFQRALTMALEMLREHGAECLVNDARHLESMSAEDQRWVRYNWAPLAIKAGVKRIAVVIAGHGLSKMAVEGMFGGQRNTGDLLQSRTFNSVADALAWLGEPR